MFFIYLWVAWLAGCGMMAVASALWRRHKARSQRIEEREAENRHQRSVLEFYENIAEGDNYAVTQLQGVKSDIIRRTRIG